MIKAIRVVALVAGLCGAVMAGWTGFDTDRFLAIARQTDGRVTAVAGRDGLVTVTFQPRAGQDATVTAEGRGRWMTGAAVPVAYVVLPGGDVDARLAVDRDLWAGMWTWIEVSLGSFLLAVFGRALIEDPLSVIGFKGAGGHR